VVSFLLLLLSLSSCCCHSVVFVRCDGDVVVVLAFVLYISVLFVHLCDFFLFFFIRAFEMAEVATDAMALWRR